MGKDNIKLKSKQVDELIDLLNKEEVFETEKKIQKALSKTLDTKLTEKPKEIMEDTGNVLEETDTKTTNLDSDAGKHILKAHEKEELVDKAPTTTLHDTTTNIPIPPAGTSTKVASAKTKDTSLWSVKHGPKREDDI